MNNILKRLLEILITHEFMRANVRQKMSELPASENQVYTLWRCLGAIIVSDAIPPCPTRRDTLPPPCSCASALSPLQLLR